MTSKARRRSKRSSSSSGSSSESSSESDSSMQSSGSDEWVESTAVSRNETEKQGSHSKRDDKNRSSRESPVHTAAPHKETKPYRSRKRTESSPESDDKKAGSRSPKCRRGRGNHVKRDMKRSSSSGSSSSRSPSGDRERERGGERDRGKGSRERDGHIVLSPKKRKTGESESYRRLGEGVCKRVQSPQRGSGAVSSIHQQSLVGMIKRIRESSGKDDELRQTSAEYCASKTALGFDRKVDNGSDSRSSKQSHNRKIERPGARKFSESFISKVPFSEGAFVSNSKAGYSEDGRVRETSKSLGSRDQRSGSSRDRKPSLVSYVTSSDEEKS